MHSCFHLDLALKLKGINIAMGGGGEGALRLLFRFGNRVLGGRGEISTECLNLFSTACSYCWIAGNRRLVLKATLFGALLVGKLST